MVAIKGPLGPLTGPHMEPLLQQVCLLPESLIKMTGEPIWSSVSETGVACFRVRIEKSGEYEVCAVVKCSSVSQAIGRQMRVKVAPGLPRFEALDAKESAEVGEQVRLVLRLSDTDMFGNKIDMPLSTRARADLTALSFQAVSVHEGKESPLNLTPPVLMDDGLLLAEPQLLLVGLHTFRIRSSGQELSANMRITPGLPHCLRLIGEGKPRVLQQRRWCSKIELLNRHSFAESFSGQQVSVELVPTSSCSDARYPCQIEAVTCESASGTMVQSLELFLAETDDAPRAGTYSLRVKRASDEREMTCEPSTIHLDLPLDPAAWTSQELAQSLRLDGLLASAANEVLKDNFDAEIDGKDLIQRGPAKAWSRLKDGLIKGGLFLGRPLKNQQEQDDAETQIQAFADALFERHTLAGLGKGRYKSSVAKTIPESDLNLEPNSFDTGGNSKVFRGHYDGRPVAVKTPLVNNRGLEMSDYTEHMMQEVERELTVTKACRHQHVVQVIGLMVGPGRIGIVMELCDTSLAKRIQHHIQDSAATMNWAETVRLLMDGAAGLTFIHQQKRTTHGDLKPDNLLIQEGRLKVADFGLATVRRTITNLTGQPPKGTTIFMAPEKMLNRAPDQPSTDVWGFGCVMANVATGKTPFFEDKNEQMLRVSWLQRKPVYEKEHALQGCPQDLLEIIDKCTQYDASKRPSMSEVEDGLRAILHGIQSQDGFRLPAPWQERACFLDSSERLIECPAGSRDYDLIRCRLEHEMGSALTVLKVEMNANVDLLRRYDLERKKISGENGGDANEVWLWHATSRECAEKSILKNGFDLNKCGLDFEYYGAGTYLAPDSKLSNRYAGRSATRTILLVRVACGKIFERKPLHLSLEYQTFVQQLALQQLPDEHLKQLRKEKTRELLRMPKNRCCPDGYHSQLGVDVPGGRKSKTEVVVNKNFQAFPAYLITYRPGPPLPDPLSSAGKGALKTFDDYIVSKFHRKACNVLL